MQLSVSHSLLPHTNSARASIVMDHFGIDFEQGDHVIARDFELPLAAGQIVLFSGASGSGKSSLMRESALRLANEQQQAVLNIDELDLGSRLLVDAIAAPIDETLRLLNTCGLGEAQLLLRTPAELSDGQRYRFRLALALSRRPQWILADEFTATLDRTLAKVIAFNLHKQSRRTGTGFLLATTHEDLAEDLQPDLHVQCRLDADHRMVQFTQTPSAENVEPDPQPKKKASRSTPNCTSPQRPKRTGRISHGGITAVTTSG